MYTEEEYDLPGYEQSPGMQAVKLRDGSTDLPPSAPKYLIAPQPLTVFAKCDLGLTVKISDLGAGMSSTIIYISIVAGLDKQSMFGLCLAILELNE